MQRYYSHVQTEIPIKSNEPAPMSKETRGNEPWQMTRKEIFGGNEERVDKSSAAWDEEGFLRATKRHKVTPISEIIYKTEPIKCGTSNPDETVIAHHEYKLGLDENKVPTLLSRTVKDSGAVWLNWHPIGEYGYGGGGILSSHRGNGVGRAFYREMMKQGIWVPDIGYSPKGARAIGNAHKDLVKQALKDGKPVPPEVLKDYPNLAKSPEPATNESEDAINAVSYMASANRYSDE